MEEEGRVGDDARGGRGLEVVGEERLQVDVLLVPLAHRERVLRAVLRRDRAERLHDDGHLGALGLERPRERVQLEAWGLSRVHEPRGRGHLGRGLGERLGGSDLLLVLRHLLAQAVERGLVALRRVDEALEELRLGVLGALRRLRVEGRQRAERTAGEPAELREGLGALLRPLVEDGGVGVDLLVGHAQRLHGTRETVQVAVRDDDGPLGVELPARDERGARGVLGAAGDDRVGRDLTEAGRGVGDRLRTRVRGGELVVVVADDHVHTVGHEGLGRGDELLGGGGVDEHDLPRLEGGELGQDSLAVAGAEELREQNVGVADLDLEHVYLLRDYLVCQTRGISDSLCQSLIPNYYFYRY